MSSVFLHYIDVDIDEENQNFRTQLENNREIT